MPARTPARRTLLVAGGGAARSVFSTSSALSVVLVIWKRLRRAKDVGGSKEFSALSACLRTARLTQRSNNYHGGGNRSRGLNRSMTVGNLMMRARDGKSRERAAFRESILRASLQMRRPLVERQFLAGGGAFEQPEVRLASCLRFE